MPKFPSLKKLLTTARRANTRRKRVTKAVLPFTIGVLIIAIPLLYFIFKNPLKVRADWWPKTENGSSWRQRKQLTITNNAPATVNAGTAVAISVDTKSLYEIGKLQSNCKDLRIVYQSSATTFKELTRFVSLRGSQTCATSGATKVYFDLETTLTSGTSSSNYYLYYDNMQATLPTSTDDVFDVGSKNAALVCSFDGTTTCAAGETNSAATPGLLPYAGTSTAISFNGHDTATSAITNFVYYTGTNLDNLPNNDTTIETWFYWRGQEASGADVITSKRGATIAGWRLELSNDSKNVLFRTDCGTNDGLYRTTSNTILQDQWNHIAVTWDASAGTARIFLNGIEPSYDTQTACTGGYLDDSANTFRVGKDNEVQQHFPGMLDEMRISNTIRYTGNFTPSTSPFVRDNNTKLLYHFDENGSYALGSIVADDSPEANHGIINGVVQFESGVVGTDTTGETGKVEGGNAFTGRSGVIVEEATVNKIPNPSFENATYDTNWVLSGGTGSDNTNKAFVKFGAHSYKIVLSDTSDRTIRDSINVGNTNTHALSAYVYRGTSGNIGGVVDATVASLVFNGASQTTTYTNMGGGWWRLSYVGTPISGATTYGVYIAEDSGTLYVDGLQLEEKNHATAYSDGSLGTGYGWDANCDGTADNGTEHDSCSARETGTITYDSTSAGISSADGTISVWIRPRDFDWDSRLSSGHGDVYKYFVSVNATPGSTIPNSLVMQWYDPDNGDPRRLWTFLVENDYTYQNPSEIEVTGNAWHMITMTWRAHNDGADFVNQYLDGTLQNSVTNQSINIDLSGSDLNIGAPSSGGHEARSLISDLRIYNNSLSATEITDLYNSFGVGHSEDIPVDAFSSAKGQDPVAIYHLDETAGSTAHDSSTYGNDLTITNATWENASLGGSGQRVRSLRFDGTGDYAMRNWDRDFNFGSGSFTISGWIRHSNIPPAAGTYDYVLSRYGNAGYKIFMSEQGYLCFAIDGNSTWSIEDYACGLSNYADASWHHFDAVKTSNTRLDMYIDGVLVNSDTSLTATGTLDSNQPLYLGIDSDGSTGSWDGNLDEVIIYPYARTADQINTNLQANQTVNRFAEKSSKGISDGLVGYWNLNEGSGTSVTDNSGNGSTGTAADATPGNGDGNTPPTIVMGKLGMARNFDGTDDYVDLGNNNSGPLNVTDTLTLAAWVKPDTITGEQTIVSKAAAGQEQYGLFLVDGEPYVVLNGTSIGAGTTVNAGEWYHIAATWNVNNNGLVAIYVNGKQVATGNQTSGGTAWQNVNIGRISQGYSYFDGSIDEVRIYSKALSSAEIAEVYDWVPGPVAYWKMDEKSGLTAYDYSGNGYDATFYNYTNGPNWTNGKVGGAYKFDSVSGRDLWSGGDIDEIDSTKTFTISAWLKVDTFVPWGIVMAEWADTAEYTQIQFGNDPGQIYTAIGNDPPLTAGYGMTAAGAFNTGEWFYFTTTYNGDGATDAEKLQIYINGVKQNLTFGGTGIPSITDDNTASMNFSTTEGFSIDDIKIYNYSRTPAQITEDMNAGHPIPGSPVGSALGEWNMDEGTGDTMHNSGNLGNTGDGDLAGSSNTCPGATNCPTWSASGYSGKALSFDGSNDYVNIGSDSQFDNIFTGGATVSVWIKPSSYGEGGYGRIFDKSASAVAMFLCQSGDCTNSVEFFREASPSGRWTAPANSITTGNWYHIVVTYDDSSLSNDPIMYINGKQVTLTEYTTPSNGFSDDSAGDLLIGSNSATDRSFAGLIDDFRIYKSLLTADQVKMLYATNGAQTQMGAVGTTTTNAPSNSDAIKYCVPGDTTTCNPPVAEWKLDENTGTRAYDTTGNGNDMTAWSTPVWTPGKIGSAVSIGSPGNNYNFVTTTPSSAVTNMATWTISAWVYPTTLQNGIYYTVINNARSGSRANYYLQAVGTEIEGGFYANSDWRRVTTSGLNLQLNTWYFVTFTFTTATHDGIIYINGKQVQKTNLNYTPDVTDSFVDLEIGNNEGWNEYWAGKIDQVTIYDYVRTPAQIAWEYNKGAPIAWYQFDECSGTTAYDSAIKPDTSTTRFNGTITPNTGRTAGTCGSGTSTEMWNGGTSGKYNASLNFDGSGDYVDMGNVSMIDGSPEASVCAWIKYSPASVNSDGIVAGEYAGANTGWTMWVDDVGAVFGHVNTMSFTISPQNTTTGRVEGSDNLITTGVWDHYCGTFKGGTYIRLYKNGKLVGENTSSIVSTVDTSSENFRIGRWGSGNYFPGQIDDVQIFNYALTPAQILQVMNQNSSTRFGP